MFQFLFGYWRNFRYLSHLHNLFWASCIFLLLPMPSVILGALAKQASWAYSPSAITTFGVVYFTVQHLITGPTLAFMNNISTIAIWLTGYFILSLAIVIFLQALNPPKKR